MSIFPIWSNNKLFGQYLSWYRRKFCEYKYNLGQGEMIMGELESLMAAGGIIGMLVLVIERWSDWLMPWQMAISLGLVFRVLKVYLGHLDRTKLKIGQAMSTYGIEQNTQPKGVELYERLTNIEKKVSPETADKKYETYFDK